MKTRLTIMLCVIPLLLGSMPGLAQSAAADVAEEVTVAGAAGAAAKPMPELFSAGYLFQVLGSLFVVFLCLFAVVYLLRRFNHLGGNAGSALKVVGSASVGQREKVVLIEAGGEQLLVGVAPGNVRMLHVLPEPLVQAQDDAQKLDFAAVLRNANPLGGAS